MSYQPPGPYPIFPQQGRSGALRPERGPMPPPVLRAYFLMLTGAALTVVKVIVILIVVNQAQHKYDLALNSGTLTDQSSVSDGSTAVGAIVAAGLWVWMALANRRGHNWARITGTVFFGISCLGILLDITLYHYVVTWLGGTGVVLIVADVVPWLVGLITVILLWHRQAGPFFNPVEPYYPGMGPAFYGTPDFTGGAPMQDAVYPPQQPTDPWGAPGGEK